MPVGTLRQLSNETKPEGHKGEVFTCAYSPDGTLILSGGWDGYLRAWDAGTGSILAAIPVSAKPLSACAVTPDGKNWLAGSMEGLFTSWDASTRSATWSFVAHTRPISAIRFASDGKTFATSSWDKQVTLRKEGAEREGRILSGHRDIVSGCAFTPDCSQLVSWSYDGSVRSWDVQRGREIGTLGSHETRVTAGTIAPDGRWAVTGALDGTLKLWDLATQTEIETALLPAEVRGLYFLADGTSFIAADATGLLSLQSAPTFEIQDQLTLDVQILCGDLAPAREQLAVGCEDGQVRLVVIEGFEDAPLPVTAAQALKHVSTGIDRLLGRTRPITTYEFTCPGCRQTTDEMIKLPEGAFACPVCNRHLRISVLLNQLQTQ